MSVHKVHLLIILSYKPLPALASIGTIFFIQCLLITRICIPIQHCCKSGVITRLYSSGIAVIMAQAVACSAQCSIPRGPNINRAAFSRSGAWSIVRSITPRRVRLCVKAASDADDCNEEACAPEKEVGKVSMEWVAEEKTKVLGTFPPTSKQRWTGYIEKDTAGQTNIYSVEPTVYVAESGISSGAAGTSAEGAENTAAISFGLGIILIAGASSVLLQVGKKPPNVENLEYSGPPLSYYIKKFNSPVVIETSAAVESQNAPSVKAESIASEISPAEGEAYVQGLQDGTGNSVSHAEGTEPAALFSSIS